MKTPGEFLTLLAALESDLVVLSEISTDNERAIERMAQGADSSLDLGAWGYTLHGAYNVLENYFLRISKFFENHLPAENWHQELLERMSLELPPMRPALIADRELAEALADLRGFRHVFRHNYGSRLRREKLALVQRSFQLVLGRFPSAHRLFVDRIASLSGTTE